MSKPPSPKLDQLRAMREANYDAAMTREPAGVAKRMRKAKAALKLATVKKSKLKKQESTNG